MEISTPALYDVINVKESKIVKSFKKFIVFEIFIEFITIYWNSGVIKLRGSIR